jgi:hypothetical protein
MARQSAHVSSEQGIIHVPFCSHTEQPLGHNIHELEFLSKRVPGGQGFEGYIQDCPSAL